MALLRLGMIVGPFIGTLFAVGSGPPQQSPEYPLFAVSIEDSYTPEELAQIAVSFCLTHGHLPAEQVAELHRLNPEFRVLSHIKSSCTSSSDPTQVPGLEPGGTVHYGIAAYRRPSPVNTTPHLWLHPQYFYGIGEPLESLDYTDIERYRLPGSNTFCRAFEHAFVFVNVDADRVDVLDLIALEKVGGSLIDPVSGDEVQEFHVRPSSGVILMRP